MSPSRRSEPEGARTERTVTLALEGFAWAALEEEAEREGLTAEDLITFSVLYYLADVDSKRISRRISRSPYPRRAEDRSPVAADSTSGA